MSIHSQQQQHQQQYQQYSNVSPTYSDINTDGQKVSQVALLYQKCEHVEHEIQRESERLQSLRAHYECIYELATSQNPSLQIFQQVDMKLYKELASNMPDSAMTPTFKNSNIDSTPFPFGRTSSLLSSASADSKRNPLGNSSRANSTANSDLTSSTLTGQRSANATPVASSMSSNSTGTLTTANTSSSSVTTLQPTLSKSASRRASLAASRRSSLIGSMGGVGNSNFITSMNSMNALNINHMNTIQTAIPVGPRLSRRESISASVHGKRLSMSLPALQREPTISKRVLLEYFEQIYTAKHPQLCNNNSTNGNSGSNGTRRGDSQHRTSSLQHQQTQPSQSTQRFHNRNKSIDEKKYVHVMPGSHNKNLRQARHSHHVYYQDKEKSELEGQDLHQTSSLHDRQQLEISDLEINKSGINTTAQRQRHSVNVVYTSNISEQNFEDEVRSSGKNTNKDKDNPNFRPSLSINVVNTSSSSSSPISRSSYSSSVPPPPPLEKLDSLETDPYDLENQSHDQFNDNNNENDNDNDQQYRYSMNSLPGLSTYQEKNQKSIGRSSHPIASTSTSIPASHPRSQQTRKLKPIQPSSHRQNMTIMNDLKEQNGDIFDENEGVSETGPSIVHLGLVRSPQNELGQQVEGKKKPIPPKGPPPSTVIARIKKTQVKTGSSLQDVQEGRNGDDSNKEMKKNAENNSKQFPPLPLKAVSPPPPPPMEEYQEDEEKREQEEKSKEYIDEKEDGWGDDGSINESHSKLDKRRPILPVKIHKNKQQQGLKIPLSTLIIPASQMNVISRPVTASPPPPPPLTPPSSSTSPCPSIPAIDLSVHSVDSSFTSEQLGEREIITIIPTFKPRLAVNVSDIQYTDEEDDDYGSYGEGDENDKQSDVNVDIDQSLNLSLYDIIDTIDVSNINISADISVSMKSTEQLQDPQNDTIYEDLYTDQQESNLFNKSNKPSINDDDEIEKVLATFATITTVNKIDGFDSCDTDYDSMQLNVLKKRVDGHKDKNIDELSHFDSSIDDSQLENEKKKNKKKDREKEKKKKEKEKEKNDRNNVIDVDIGVEVDTGADSGVNSTIDANSHTIHLPNHIYLDTSTSTIASIDLDPTTVQSQNQDQDGDILSKSTKTVDGTDIMTQTQQSIGSNKNNSNNNNTPNNSSSSKNKSKSKSNKQKSGKKSKSTHTQPLASPPSPLLITNDHVDTNSSPDTSQIQPHSSSNSSTVSTPLASPTASSSPQEHVTSTKNKSKLSSFKKFAKLSIVSKSLMKEKKEKKDKKDKKDKKEQDMFNELDEEELEQKTGQGIRLESVNENNDILEDNTQHENEKQRNNDNINMSNNVDDKSVISTPSIAGKAKKERKISIFKRKDKKDKKETEAETVTSQETIPNASITPLVLTPSPSLHHISSSPLVTSSPNTDVTNADVTIIRSVSNSISISLIDQSDKNSGCSDNAKMPSYPPTLPEMNINDSNSTPRVSGNNISNSSTRSRDVSMSISFNTNIGVNAATNLLSTPRPPPGPPPSSAIKRKNRLELSKSSTNSMNSPMNSYINNSSVSTTPNHTNNSTMNDEHENNNDNLVTPTSFNGSSVKPLPPKNSNLSSSSNIDSPISRAKILTPKNLTLDESQQQNTQIMSRRSTSTFISHLPPIYPINTASNPSSVSSTSNRSHSNTPKHASNTYNIQTGFESPSQASQTSQLSHTSSPISSLVLSSPSYATANASNSTNVTQAINSPVSMPKKNITVDVRRNRKSVGFIDLVSPSNKNSTKNHTDSDSAAATTGNGSTTNTSAITPGNQSSKRHSWSVSTTGNNTSSRLKLQQRSVLKSSPNHFHHSTYDGNNQYYQAPPSYHDSYYNSAISAHTMINTSLNSSTNIPADIHQQQMYHTLLTSGTTVTNDMTEYQKDIGESESQPSQQQQQPGTYTSYHMKPRYSQMSNSSQTQVYTQTQPLSSSSNDQLPTSHISHTQENDVCVHFAHLNDSTRGYSLNSPTFPVRHSPMAGTTTSSMVCAECDRNRFFAKHGKRYDENYPVITMNDMDPNILVTLCDMKLTNEALHQTYDELHAYHQLLLSQLRSMTTYCTVVEYTIHQILQEIKKQILNDAHSVNVLLQNIDSYRNSLE